jgi:hypothetical protein
MTDFIQLETKATVAIQPDVVPPTNQAMLLTPNDLCDLTPFGINKVLNKELPVILQVIDIMEETLTAREKVTMIEPDGSTTFFFSLNPKTLLYPTPPEPKLFSLMEKSTLKRRNIWIHGLCFLCSIFPTAFILCRQLFGSTL